MLRLVLITLVLLLLTACGTDRLTPSNQLVQRALALQVEQTQQQLSQQLNLDFQGFEINRVAVKQRQPLVIQDLPAYHVQGTYDLTLKLSNQRLNQQQNTFDIYLQRQKEGKTWRLAIPQMVNKNQGLNWLTYLIL